MIIRKLASQKDYLAAEGLQRKVWAFPDREIIPLNELVVVQHNGGHVFGAFERGRMVGFCWGLPGFRDGRAYHCSRMLGILPGLRDDGLGTRLKLVQRRYVLEQGLDLITWTFDPLQSRNAYLNIEKLGVVITEYFPNLYPASRSRFNRGMQTDRFLAEWWIRSRHVARRLEGRSAPTLLPIALALPPTLENRRTGDGWLEPGRARLSLREKSVALEIPDDINPVKEASLATARRWRMGTRRVLQAYLSRGYVIHAFATGADRGHRRSLYVLEKGFRVA